MEKPKVTVARWAKLIDDNDLKKSAICRRAGVQNSIYSYARKRGKKGLAINEEHERKISAAIDEEIAEKKKTA